MALYAVIGFYAYDSRINDANGFNENFLIFDVIIDIKNGHGHGYVEGIIQLMQGGNADNLDGIDQGNFFN